MKELFNRIKRPVQKTLACMLAIAMLFTSANITTEVKGAEKISGFNMRQGASIRISEPSGIRFVVEISGEAKSILLDDNNNLKENVKIGMLVVPENILSSVSTSEDVDYIKAITEKYGKTKDQITTEFSNEQFSLEDGKVTAAAAIVNIKDKNYAKGYQAVAYYSLDNGETYTYSEKSEVRTIGYVADRTLADMENMNVADDKVQTLGNILWKYIAASNNNEDSIYLAVGETADFEDTFLKGIDDTTKAYYNYDIFGDNTKAVSLDGKVVTANEIGVTKVSVSAYGGVVRRDINVYVVEKSVVELGGFNWNDGLNTYGVGISNKTELEQTSWYSAIDTEKGNWASFTGKVIADGTETDMNFDFPGNGEVFVRINEKASQTIKISKDTLFRKSNACIQFKHNYIIDVANKKVEIIPEESTVVIGDFAWNDRTDTYGFKISNKAEIEKTSWFAAISSSKWASFTGKVIADGIEVDMTFDFPGNDEIFVRIKDKASQNIKISKNTVFVSDDGAAKMKFDKNYTIDVENKTASETIDEHIISLTEGQVAWSVGTDTVGVVMTNADELAQNLWYQALDKDNGETWLEFSGMVEADGIDTNMSFRIPGNGEILIRVYDKANIDVKISKDSVFKTADGKLAFKFDKDYTVNLMNKTVNKTATGIALKLNGIISEDWYLGLKTSDSVDEGYYRVTTEIDGTPHEVVMHYAGEQFYIYNNFFCKNPGSPDNKKPTTSFKIAGGTTIVQVDSENGWKCVEGGKSYVMDEYECYFDKDGKWKDNKSDIIATLKNSDQFLTFADNSVDGRDVSKIQDYIDLGFTTALASAVPESGKPRNVKDSYIVTVTEGKQKVSLAEGQQKLTLAPHDNWTNYGTMALLETNLPTDGTYQEFSVNNLNSGNHNVSFYSTCELLKFNNWYDGTTNKVYLDPYLVSGEYFRAEEKIVINAGTKFVVNSVDYVATSDIIITIKNDYLQNIENLYKKGLNVWIRNFDNKPGYFDTTSLNILKSYKNMISGFYIADEAFETDTLLNTAGKEGTSTSFEAIANSEISWIKENFPSAVFHTNQVGISSYDHYGNGKEPSNKTAYKTAYANFLNNYTTKVLNNLGNAGKTICYDNYPFGKKDALWGLISSDSMADDYLFNMLIAAKEAKNAPEGTHFGICVQTFTGEYTNGRDITCPEEVTFQLYTGISMGADMFEYFTYDTYNDLGTGKVEVNGIIDVNGKKRIYDLVKTANTEVFPWAKIIKAYDWQGIQLSKGKTHDNSTDFDSINSAFKGDSVLLTDSTNGVLSTVSSNRDAVIGCFKKDGKDGYMIVNYNDPKNKKYNNTVDMTFADCSSVTVYTSDGTNVNEQNVAVTDGKYSVTIAPGKAAFVVAN